MGWNHLLRVWVCLPRAQPILLAVHSRNFSDNGATDDDDDADDDDAEDDNDASSDDDHEQHAETGRVQALLRAELGQLVVQMHMGLLYRVLAMYNNDQQQHCFSNGHYDGNLRGNNLLIGNGEHDRSTCFHNSTAAGVQAGVRTQRKAVGEEVQAGPVQRLCRMRAAGKAACRRHTASERCCFCIDIVFRIVFRNTLKRRSSRH